MEQSRANYVSDDQLSKMNFTDLRMLRDKPGADQNRLAPYEHRAFAREYVATDPWKAIPSLAVAIPGYTAAKALGVQSARSDPSFNDIGQGYTPCP
jgi:hypothetical protein